MNAAKAGRFRLLLAVLLTLVGLSAVPAAGIGAGPRSASVIIGSGSATPATHDTPHEPLRLAQSAPSALTTAVPNTWFALCPNASGGWIAQGRAPLGDVDGTATTDAASTPRSSRAPPATRTV